MWMLFTWNCALPRYKIQNTANESKWLWRKTAQELWMLSLTLCNFPVSPSPSPSLIIEMRSNILHPPFCSSHRLLCSTTNTSERYERTRQGNLLETSSPWQWLELVLLVANKERCVRLSGRQTEIEPMSWYQSWDQENLRENSNVLSFWSWSQSLRHCSPSSWSEASM